MKRSSLNSKQPREGVYFKKKAKRKFIKSGCTLLDCVLGGPGGGWPHGRIINLVGDSSTGKTLLAEEACTNFHIKYEDGHIWYREVESAFDADYADCLGLPLDSVDFGPDGLETVWETVEEIMADMAQCIKQAKESGQPGIYVLDSLDALSSKAELERDPTDGTYGLEKQKMLGQLFRKYVRRLSRNNITVVIISQVRDRIGIGFGDKHTRSGGKSLQFYASIVLWLSHIKMIDITSRGIKKPIATRIRARCKKNKIAPPFRECDLIIRFNYGVDEVMSCMEWLKNVGAANEIDGFKEAKSNVNTFIKNLERLQPDEYKDVVKQIQTTVKQVWAEIEEDFAPKRQKYA